MLTFNKSIVSLDSPEFNTRSCICDVDHFQMATVVARNMVAKSEFYRMNLLKKLNTNELTDILKC